MSFLVPGFPHLEGSETSLLFFTARWYALTSPERLIAFSTPPELTNYLVGSSALDSRPSAREGRRRLDFREVPRHCKPRKAHFLNTNGLELDSNWCRITSTMPLWLVPVVPVYVLPSVWPRLASTLLVSPSSSLLVLTLSLPRVVSMLLLESRLLPIGFFGTCSTPKCISLTREIACTRMTGDGTCTTP